MRERVEAQRRKSRGPGGAEVRLPQPAGWDVRPVGGASVGAANTPTWPAEDAIPASPMFVQPKLILGAPNDRYEEEASRLAARIGRRTGTPRLSAPDQEAVRRQATGLEGEYRPVRLKRPAIQRIAHESGHPVSPAMEAMIEQARGGGEPLPGGLREPMEQALGADLRDVRLHRDPRSDRLSRSMQAWAFTTGRDIFFRRGAYDPGNPGGRELLAHELTHVVQQTGVAPMPRQSAADGGDAPLAGPVSERCGGERVQRLISAADFRTQTTGMFSGDRKRIDAVDTKLAAYDKTAAPQARFDALAEIISACNTYLTLPDRSASRTKGVTRLRDDARQEKEVVKLILEGQASADPKEKVRKLNRAKDVSVQARAAGHDITDDTTGISNLVGPAIQALSSAEEEALIKEDMRALSTVALSASTPQITKDVIAEAQSNQANVKFEEGPPGATLEPPGGPEKYRVKHKLDQPLGVTERLGSLAHELTHVSIGETFRNTVLLLAFDPTASPAAIQQLDRQRNQNVAALKDLCAKDKVLNAEQKLLVKSKLEYAEERKLSLYAARFYDVRTPAHKKLTTNQFNDLNALAAQVTNSIIEYDSVINQILVYMQGWGIPMNNPFYRRLRTVAEEAYQYRKAYRDTHP